MINYCELGLPRGTADFVQRPDKKISNAQLVRKLGQPLKNVMAYNYSLLVGFDYTTSYPYDRPYYWNTFKYNGYCLAKDVIEVMGNAYDARVELCKKYPDLAPALVMLACMTVSAKDFPGEKKWTKVAPQYDISGKGLIANCVWMTPDGRLVADKNSWFGIQKIAMPAADSVSYFIMDAAVGYQNNRWLDLIYETARRATQRTR